MVGTGPFQLTDYVSGSSYTLDRNPNYWGHDEKYPDNQLPYVDQMRGLWMPEEATRLAALRSGKIDGLHAAGVSQILSVDVAQNLQRDNPEMQVTTFFTRSNNGFALNTHRPPFDDVRVRRAMQMALDLETISNAYYKGQSLWKPQGQVGEGATGYYIPFEEWPEELKGYYTYDPEGAEKLLDEAGYPRGADGRRFKVTTTFRDVYDLGYTEIATGYWAEIGVDVEIVVVDSPGFASARNEITFDMISATGGQNNPAAMTGYSRHAAFASPEWTALADAFHTATTFEEEAKAAVEYDMYILWRHTVVWGPKNPTFQAAQQWVKGWNGEWDLGPAEFFQVLARLWVDQELKAELGF